MPLLIYPSAAAAVFLCMQFQFVFIVGTVSFRQLAPIMERIRNRFWKEKREQVALAKRHKSDESDVLFQAAAGLTGEK